MITKQSSCMNILLKHGISYDDSMIVDLIADQQSSDVELSLTKNNALNRWFRRKSKLRFLWSTRKDPFCSLTYDGDS